MTGPVLGLNFGTHDAAAAVVAQGRVLAAAEEERFSRTKHTKAFPERALRYCLHEAGVDARDVDSVALFVDPRRQLMLPLVNLYHGFPASLGSVISDLGKYRRRNAAQGIIRDSRLFRADCRIVPIVHHRAHAASAYLLSPFDDALVVTIDGRGEYETACIFDGRGGTLTRRHSIVYPHSIGYLYSMVTRYLGFRPQRDEYKVMGLAAYGSPSLDATIAQLARFDHTSGRFRLNLAYFDHHRRPSNRRQLYSPRLVSLLGPPRHPDEEITDRHRDIAHALQQLTERLIGDYLRYAQSLVPRRNLCLAGGVALNCVANATVLDSARFDRVFVQPAANDAGTSIGAALLAEGRTTRHALDHAFLGPGFDTTAIGQALDQLPHDYRITRTDRPHTRAAELINADNIIGWFQGRMEFGPRALGARSILTAARDATVVDRINALIKRRELFRPLAPAVLTEQAGEYFQIHPAGRDVYPFMLATAPVRAAKRAIIPAVVHVDGSARVQTVHRHTNPHLWPLLDAYRTLTGIPVVLNTSFNGADEPIVCTPADAHVPDLWTRRPRDRPLRRGAPVTTPHPTTQPHLPADTTSDTELLVVYKPNGLRRHCTPNESHRTLTAWTSLLCWLRGADPDDLPESDLIGHVARKAALRMLRFPEYDIHLWAHQARSLNQLPHGEPPNLGTLTDLAPALLSSIQLQRTHAHRCWLNRVAIELLYGQSAPFQRNRDILIPLLLNGPVAIERWTGHRRELAFAAKHLLRRALSTEALTNLIHMEITTATNVTNFLKTVEITT